MRIPPHSVCTAIREDIVSRVFRPGERLAEEQLARRYGVSRVPVREALRTLESEGFIVARRHAGACVAEPTEHEAADLLEVWTLLEPLAVERAARRRTDAHLKVLRGLVKLGQDRARHGHLDELRALGSWFHETLARASGSPELIALLARSRQKIAWMYVGESPARPLECWAEHAAILDMVARGDAARARALAAAHAERSAQARTLRTARPDGVPTPGRTARPARSAPDVPPARRGAVSRDQA
ncbi:GntR family transcriptional regulator, partial [Streptomyces sp. NPDC057638]|uniref:GntR family transcriptional regulator n=1 Tax=Streptomyces sp. NPDC057638 TaxID=3346190 RepID=UPI0036A19FA4